MTPATQRTPEPGLTASIPARRRRFSRRPDARLLLGVALVLVSVVVGARLVGSGEQGDMVWSTRSPLAAGTTLTAADLVPVTVSLGDSATRYATTSESLAGRTLNRDHERGELIPMASLAEPARGRVMSIPVDADHAPASLGRGQRIDVFATTDPGTAGARTEIVLQAVPVQEVQRGGGGLSTAASLSVVVVVPPAEAIRVVQALQSADIDVSRVLETQ